jgi:acetyl-CoA carboxylase biotin carboxyl carrier protein
VWTLARVNTLSVCGDKELDMNLDIKQIKQLVTILKKEGVEEFEWKSGDESLRMKRFGGGQNQVSGTIEPVVAIAKPTVQAVSDRSESGKLEPSPGNQFITSPIVGTFYRAPSPKAEPYAKEGDKVTKGQVLCIVEAMKLMNELDAEYPCEIVRILVKNAEPVEFGEPIFEVKPL